MTQASDETKARSRKTETQLRNRLAEVSQKRVADKAGLSPRDLRNWGAVFAQAARLGYIARDYTYTFRRATSNGSLGVGWKPLIHSHKEKALSATN